MKPSDVLHRELSGTGTVMVTGRGTDTITILGASMPVSVRLGATVNTFALVPPTDGGMVALRVHSSRWSSSKKWHQETYSFFLSVADERGEGSDIDLEHLWGPQSDRLGQIEGSYLEAQIGNDLFTTRPQEYWDQYPTSMRRHYVPDGNVICRYLTGGIGADALRAAATTHEEEVTAKERLPEVEQELGEVRLKLAATECEAVEFQLAYSHIRATLNDTRDALRVAGRKLDGLVVATNALLVEARKRRCKSRAFRNAIRTAEERMAM